MTQMNTDRRNPTANLTDSNAHAAPEPLMQVAALSGGLRPPVSRAITDPLANTYAAVAYAGALRSNTANVLARPPTPPGRMISEPVTCTAHRSGQPYYPASRDRSAAAHALRSSSSTRPAAARPSTFTRKRAERDRWPQR